MQPTIGELSRRIDHIEHEIEVIERDSDGFNARICREIDAIKLQMAHLQLGFNAIKWLSVTVFGSAITVLVAFVLSKVLK